MEKPSLSDCEKFAIELSKILLANSETSSSIDICNLKSVELINDFISVLSKKFHNISIKNNTIEILKILCKNEKTSSSFSFENSASIEAFLSFIEKLNTSLK
ncbi:hypothetical protein [Clostridium sp. MD294]|uniref:hypothetical protein n=1 Tax=Clostridium sp. MD294 TaxID=97138 RepID=UPI0002C90024|nr:hypothetical protein [Clostridium sp. MD294]NDO45853.1 hypothetical protein [Clostridium sp. MD294]USF30491.1 hypothetical protein C820_001932 [Clostridium sp. MD294]